MSSLRLCSTRGRLPASPMMQLGIQVSKLPAVLLVLAALVGATVHPLPKRNRSADNMMVLVPAKKPRTGQQVASAEFSGQTTQDLRRASVKPAAGSTCSLRLCSTDRQKKERLLRKKLEIILASRQKPRQGHEPDAKENAPDMANARDTRDGCDSEMAEDGASCEAFRVQPIEPLYATALLEHACPECIVEGVDPRDIIYALVALGELVHRMVLMPLRARLGLLHHMQDAEMEDAIAQFAHHNPLHFRLVRAQCGILDGRIVWQSLKYYRIRTRLVHSHAFFLDPERVSMALADMRNCPALKTRSRGLIKRHRMMCEFNKVHINDYAIAPLSGHGRPWGFRSVDETMLTVTTILSYNSIATMLLREGRNESAHVRLVESDLVPYYLSIFWQYGDTEVFRHLFQRCTTIKFTE